VKFVLDASLALAWCFRDERTNLTEAVLQALPKLGAAVPPLWIYEVTNALRTAQKASRLTEVAAMEFVEDLLRLPIEPVALPPRTMLVEVRLLAVQHNLSVYDASYLALAHGLGLPLATLDGSGKRMGIKLAAVSLGVDLVHEAAVAAWSRA
jgi:predicted nucleic acid-binding protein